MQSRRPTASNGLAFALAVVALAAITVPLVAQKPRAAAPAWHAPRTPDGQPDIQGLWNSVNSFFTPLQRPAGVSDAKALSADEVQTVLEEEAGKKLENSDRGTGAYGHEWYEYKRHELGTALSLIVDPANGRIPAMTPWAKQKTAEMRARAFDSYEFLDPGDRCISRGILGIMLPTFYNNGKRILQSPGYVTIVSEMIHDARIIPIDGRPHTSSALRSWNGDPRGRWDGNTLVVETINFSARDVLRNIGIQTERLRMVERFTAVNADTLMYRVTIDDPTVYTSAWSIEFPFTRDSGYEMFEYACHEGNHAVPNMLSGARAQEGNAALSPR
jgi:hypothetical protein